MQKVLTMSTYGSDLRSEAWGWNAEDGDEASDVMHEAMNETSFRRGHEGPGPRPTPMQVYNRRPVGLMGYYGKRTGNMFYSYATPYHALGDGWKLLAPPTSYLESFCEKGSDVKVERKCYEWWFVKDSI